MLAAPLSHRHVSQRNPRRSTANQEDPGYRGPYRTARTPFARPDTVPTDLEIPLQVVGAFQALHAAEDVSDRHAFSRARRTKRGCGEQGYAAPLDSGKLELSYILPTAYTPTGKA